MTATEYLSHFFVAQDSIDTAKDVSAQQQRILDRQYSEGKRGVLEYYDLSGKIKEAGVAIEKDRDRNSNPLGIIPWWLWLAGALAIFIYLGGGVWLIRKSKGVLAR